jgi:hypothetical protein
MISRSKNKSSKIEIACWATLLPVGFLAGMASMIFLFLAVERIVHSSSWSGISYIMPPSWFFVVGGLSIVAFPIVGAVSRKQLDAGKMPTPILLKAALLIWLLGICISYRYVVLMV